MTHQEQWNLCLALAAERLRQSRAAYSPVADAVCQSKSDAQSEQTTSQQQVAGQGGGSGSNNPTIVSGAGEGSGQSGQILSGQTRMWPMFQARATW